MGSKNRKGEPFYEKGLQFECLECGACCTGFPGYVYLSREDIRRIARFLRMGVEDFCARYTRLVSVFHERRLSLIERRGYDCVFWEERCTIYPARPTQCRTFPFWKRRLVSRSEWEKTGALCPGINRGRVYTRQEIERRLADVPDYNLDRFEPSHRVEPNIEPRP